MSKTHDDRESPVDLTGDASVLPDSYLTKATPRSFTVEPHVGRVASLTACRESSVYSQVLMEGMVQQTLAYMPNLPSVQEAKLLGLTPLTAPKGELPQLSRIKIHQGKATGVLFNIDLEYFLYSMSSAATTTTAGENDWTTMCAGVIEQLRPQEMYVASISRLVRSFEHAGTLLSAISKNVDVVHAGAQLLRMRGEGSEAGQLMWSVLAMIAAAERNLIVQRLTAGLVAKYRRGEWIKGVGAVPFGYAFDPVSKNLFVDPASREALLAAWTMLADPNLAVWQIVQHLGDLGVTTRLAKKRFGEKATVADFKDPASFVMHLHRWSHLYLTGEHTTRWPNPFEGVQHFAGMPVFPTTGNKSELHFHYSWGRPDIDPALIQAAFESRKKGAASPITGGAARSHVAPMNGYKWIQDQQEFWLSSASETQYHLRVRGLNAQQS